MYKVKYMIIYVLILMSAYSSNLKSQTKNGNIIVDDIKRTYLIHIPELKNLNANLPLVIVLHGHGGTGKQIMKESGFNEYSDKDTFVVVYPNGINKGWNDGRELNGNEDYDDVKFISQLIDNIIFEYKIDTNRIFATGISNGGIFSFYLADKLSNRFLAIAPVAANIPANLVKDYNLKYPTSLLLINGTEDPLIKYEGGKVGFKIGKYRGWTISTDSTISIFKNLNKCKDKPEITDMPDIIEEDDCQAVRYEYDNGLMNSDVTLIKIINGGHTWPGGKQYLPKFVVGNVCRDFDAADVIWKFFKLRKARNN